MPHPANANVLPRGANPVSHLKHKGRGYSTHELHPGNSSISYVSGKGETGAGHIEFMWQILLNGQPRVFIFVSPYCHLSQEHELKNPYQLRPGFLGTIVYPRQVACNNLVVIQQAQVIGHVAFYNRPFGTFGIPVPTTIILDSLHCNRI